MAKASIVLPDGTKVTVQGGEDEVAAVISKVSSSGPASEKKTKRGKTKRESRARGRRERKVEKRKGPTGLIRELLADGFFKSERSLGNIQDKLRERGHIYPAHALSPAVLGLVRRKELRRFKKKKQWVYVA